jgi:hypothetical protein
MSKEFSRCPDCGKIFDAGIQPLSDDAVLGEGWRDARKELPDNKKYVLVWYKPSNKKFRPDVMKIYFENNKFWYDESKYEQFGGVVFAWQYLIPPAFA